MSNSIQQGPNLDDESRASAKAKLNWLKAKPGRVDWRLRLHKVTSTVILLALNTILFDSLFWGEVDNGPSPRRPQA